MSPELGSRRPYPEFGALVLFTARFDAMVSFYRAIGLPLREESHDDGPVHFACELGPVHFAIFESAAGDAAEPRTGGSSISGFAVSSLQQALADLRSLGARVVEEPSEYPWGPRFLVADPDGRVVEVF